MDLERKRICTCAEQAKADTQITLEEDFIVPDVLGDLEKIIAHRERAVLESVKSGPDAVSVRGSLNFIVLYASPEEGSNIHSMDGKIPFEETIHMEGTKDGDVCDVSWEIEDFTIHAIHSRKICARAILSLKASKDLHEDREAISEIRSERGILTKKMILEHAEPVVVKRDIYRIREEIELEKGRPDILKILWNQMELRGTDTKLSDGRLSLSGELVVFVLYRPEEDTAPLQWFESTLPFSGQIEVPGAEEDLIPEISLSLMTADVTAKPDFDGELREVDADAVIDIRMKLYREKHTELVADAYSLRKQILPKTENIRYETIPVKNASRQKVQGKIGIPADAGKILQICHASGSVTLDEAVPVERGIEAEGILKVWVLYASSDDRYPLAMAEGVIPFKQKIDVPQMRERLIPEMYEASAKSDRKSAEWPEEKARISTTENRGKNSTAERKSEDSLNSNMKSHLEFEISHSLEQLTAQAAGEGEIQVKAVVLLDTLVTRQETAEVIMDVKEEPFDMEALENMPAMTGYQVRENETLWDIAKHYHTTEENIMAVNDLTMPEVSEGDRILLVKEAVVEE
ncbi:MAG: DUF3794 domain-containing protein [Lachnospiraceae bacterium]|nr:DUF3794 domain-containing protein [Lachnospiraceae bacterium]